MSAPLALPAPAKINLYLHVRGRRADGYHELDSLIAFADLADAVEVAEAGRLALELEGPFAQGLDAGGDNLALRAARAAAKLAGAGRFAAVRIVKNIPVAAGLGGGSADAAAVLRGLTRIWEIDAARLVEVAPWLGSDVPVCLFGRPAFVSGAGDAIEAAPALPRAGLLLVNPGTRLVTADVFAAYDRAGGAPVRRPRPDLAGAADAGALALALEGTANDLTAGAAGLAPEVEAVLDAVAGLDGCRLARMTGSGPTCFGLFDDAVAARAALEALQAGRPGWWAWAGGFAGEG